MLGHERDGEVACDECAFHDHERGERTREGQPRVAASDAHQLGAVSHEAVADRDHTHRGRRKPEHVRRATEGGVHLAAPVTGVAPGTLPPTSASFNRALFFDS